MSDLEKELTAMRTIAEAMSDLDEEARQRIMFWVSSQFDVEVDQPNNSKSGEGGRQVQTASELGVFSDFFDRCVPSTEADKALTATYWLKFERNMEDVTGRQVNDLLRDVGHELSNVTVSFRTLENRKPSLARQSSKARGKMGHKTYRMTAAGEKAIGRMMRTVEAGEADDA